MQPNLELSLWDGVAELAYVPVGFETSGFTVHDVVRVELFVSRSGGVLVIRIRKPPGVSLGVITWELSRARHAPHPAPAACASGTTGWIAQTLLPADAYVMAAAASGGRSRVFAAGERVTGDISIVTRYHLTDGIGQGRTADVVEYAGGRYIVKNTFDYSNWGRGFVMAVCDMLPVGGV